MGKECVSVSASSGFGNTASKGAARETLRDLPAIVEQVIAAYYSKDYEPLFARITEGCTFIGACREVFHGADELRAALPESEAPVMFLRDAVFEIASPGCESRTDAVVVGTYQVYTGPRETMLCSVKQRATVCCTLSADGWKAYHIHTSNEWNEVVGDEVFPVKTSRETYEYVRAILRTERRAGMLPRASRSRRPPRSATRIPTTSCTSKRAGSTASSTARARRSPSRRS